MSSRVTTPSISRSLQGYALSTARWLATLALALAVIPSLCIAQVTSEQLLQEAVYRDEVEGDLEGAVRLCRQIIDQTSTADSLIVCAHLRLALCYEKKGDAHALEIYRQVLRRLPKDSQAARAAQTRLGALSLSAPDYSAMVDQYLARIGIERLGAVSPDGSLEAHTDWSTGNLIVKNRRTGKVTRLTRNTWAESAEFAYYKVWSPDGKKIAYGWYRDNSCIGLRIISADGGEPKIVLERAGMYLFPTDWSRDGKRILARIARPSNGAMRDSMTLSTIDILSGECTPLIRIDGNSRGLQFSPDGRFVVLDYFGQDDNTREIYTLSVSDPTLRKLSGEIIGEKDTPYWSATGEHVLFRATAAGEKLLMAIPVREGIASGKPHLLQMNIQAVIQRRAGIQRQQLVAAMEKQEQASLLTDRSPLDAFDDDFESARLNPAWKVVQWEGPNVYGFKTFGRVSLSDRQGYLRYYLDPMALWMLPLSRTIFGDGEGYWYYPALQLRRMLAGTSWMLETRATYGLVRPADGRYFVLGVHFSNHGIFTGSLLVQRIQAWEPHAVFSIGSAGNESATGRNGAFSLPGDTLESMPCTCHIRITRRDTILTVQMSEDGISYELVSSARYPREALGNEQQLLVMGGGWFAPAGAYVDFDYFRFRPLTDE